VLAPRYNILPNLDLASDSLLSPSYNLTLLSSSTWTRLATYGYRTVRNLETAQTEELLGARWVPDPHESDVLNNESEHTLHHYSDTPLPRNPKGPASFGRHHLGARLTAPRFPRIFRSDTPPGPLLPAMTMASLFGVFTRTSLLRRLLKYALSKLDLFEEDDLDLDSLDLNLGMKTVVEFRNVGIKPQVEQPGLRFLVLQI
jgi:hypothetical protein